MSKALVQIEWGDVPHLTAAQKSDLYASIPPHQRDARTKGIPQLGAGVVYPVAESELVVPPFQIPVYYRRAYALDVGWKRTGVLWGAHDPENDILYLTNEYYRGQAEPGVHALAIRALGDWIPGTVDPAARGRTQDDGEQLIAKYRDQGLQLTPANNAVEAGIYEVWMRMTTGRLKIFEPLSNFRAEMRVYRRDEKGRIVKDNDHLMDCCRYLCATGVHIAQVTPSKLWSGGIANERGDRLPLGKNCQHKVDYDPMAEMLQGSNWGQDK